MSSRDTVVSTVRLPRTLHAELVKVAARELSSVNREIIIAVRAHLDADRRGSTDDKG